MFPFPRHRAPHVRTPKSSLLGQPHDRLIFYHLQGHYFHPDGKAVNIFPTDSICSSKIRFLNLGTTDILTLWGGWPVHRRRFCNTWLLHPLDASSIPSCNDQKCPTFPSSPISYSLSHFSPYENHCSNLNSGWQFTFRRGISLIFWLSAWHMVRYLINICFLTSLYWCLQGLLLSLVLVKAMA